MSNFLHNAEEIIRENLNTAKGNSEAALWALAKIGDALNDAKGYFAEDKERGNFVEWAANNFGFAKAWAYRLVQLHNKAEAIRAAFAWAPTAGLDPVKFYSVDGALKLAALHLAATNDEARAKAEERAAKASETKAKREAEREKAETEAERLRKYIAKLERENAKLRAELAAATGEAPKSDGAKAKGNGAAGPDKATRDRARKVHGLYTRGATEGERAAAQSRLEEMARKHGMSFAEFMAACGLAV